MPALPATQQSDWNNNVYVLWTTRGLAMVGVFGLAYMVKRSYIRMPSIRGTGVGSLVAASVGAAPLAAGGFSFPFRYDSSTKWDSSNG